MISFSGCHYPKFIILQYVRWYILCTKLSEHRGDDEMVKAFFRKTLHQRNNFTTWKASEI